MALVAPNLTPEAAVVFARPVPVMVTVIPPRVELPMGLTEVTVGVVS